MKEIENLLTTKEVAEQLGVDPRSIVRIWEYLTSTGAVGVGKIQNGKTTYWNKAEITLILDKLKNNNNNQNQVSRQLANVSTELTPALKIKKAFDLMQEGYEEEIENLQNKLSHKDNIIKGQGIALQSFIKLSDENYCNEHDGRTAKERKKYWYNN
jgi:DNA-binding transcriptional regulator YhcF (GntR family)